MTITYPLSLPARGPSDIKITYSNIQAVHQSPWTGEEQVQDSGTGYWSLSLTWQQVNGRALAQPILSFIAALRGATGTFLSPVDKLRSTPMGSASGTPLVSGANAARATQLVTKGWTANATGVLLAGDLFQLGGGDTGLPERVYEVLADVNADGSGNATIEIRPDLRDAGYGDNVPLILDNPVGLFCLANPDEETTLGNAIAYGIQLDAVEALVL